MTPPEAMMFAFLAVQSYLDLRFRKISLLFCVITAGAGGLHIFWNRLPEMPLCLLAFLPGAFLFLASYASRDAIGRGDGIVLMTCGFFLSVSASFSTLMFGLLLSSFFAVFLIAVKKKKRTASFPFLPFLGAGYLCTFLVTALG